jgi:hypothetical protein
MGEGKEGTMMKGAEQGLKSSAEIGQVRGSEIVPSVPKWGSNASAFPDINTHGISYADRLLANSEKKFMGL